MYPNQPFNPGQQPNFNHGSNLIAPYSGGGFNQKPQFQNPNQINQFPPNIHPPVEPVPVKSKPNYLFILIITALVFFSIGSGYFLYDNRGSFSIQIPKIISEGANESQRISILKDINNELDIKNLSFSMETQFAKFETDPNKPAINPALYRTFTGPEFTEYYNKFEYTNVKEITTKPTIRSTVEADKVIQDIAEKRGYKLRFEAIETRLVFVDGQKLQPEAQLDWLQLKTAAAKDKIELVLTSGYRSIIDQKNLFNSDLKLDATKDPEIAAGKQNSVIDETLQTTSIPGYSRHHTGYTIDVSCGNKNQKIFSQSECYDWLSRYNYLNAKRFGFLPSYPQGSPNQGPNPEAWEYVWVGEKNLRS